jgi:SAM-dependent methyltransferase
VEGWQGYDAASYGDRVADVYDQLFHPSDSDAAVACLADLAGSGPALELAIGTGRLALPLAARGVAMSGIDASEAMVAKLRAKPGGDQIAVAIGDFADVDVNERFSLIFIAYNTFFVLLDPAAQRRCFERVAAHLDPGGRFVLEAFVPDPGRFERGQNIEVTQVALDYAVFSVSRHDAATQRVDSLLVRVSDNGVRTWPVRLRYSYPSELDLMGDRAGLQLEHRWGSWDREPFTNESVKQVSVYAAPM